MAHGSAGDVLDNHWENCGDGQISLHTVIGTRNWRKDCSAYSRRTRVVHEAAATLKPKGTTAAAAALLCGTSSASVESKEFAKRVTRNLSPHRKSATCEVMMIDTDERCAFAKRLPNSCQISRHASASKYTSNRLPWHKQGLSLIQDSSMFESCVALSSAK